MTAEDPIPEKLPMAPDAPPAAAPGPTRSRAARVRKERLYAAGQPVSGFNEKVRKWLAQEIVIVEHATPKAFGALRIAYDLEVDAFMEKGMDFQEAHRRVCSDLTKLMFGGDITGELSERLSAENINARGFRTALSQGVAKNTGENFINALVYSLASVLADQDDVLVDKGLPAPLKPLLTIGRVFQPPGGAERTIKIEVESDMAIWRRDAPHQAVILSAKTRLKEIFHVGTMWAILFGMIGDPYCQEKWGLKATATNLDMQYVFATADMIPSGGTRTQGPDVERDEVRNLIAMDASFFDYVFVTKTGIGHASSVLDVASQPREALFHEAGCLFDLVGQKFGLWQDA